MSTRYSPKTVTNGLVLCYDSANGKSYVSGNTTWTDISQTGNSATLPAPTANTVCILYASGTLGFDGFSGSAICNGNASIPTASHTVEFVYFNSSSANQYPTLYSRVGQNDVNGFWWVYTYGPSANTNLYWQYSTTGSTHVAMLLDTNAAPTLAWVYGVIVVDYTLDNERLVYYKNGVQLSSQYIPAIRTVTASNTVCVGTYQGINGLGGYNVRGYLPVFKIYNRVLTADEVVQNFNAIRGRFGL